MNYKKYYLRLFKLTFIIRWIIIRFENCTPVDPHPVKLHRNGKKLFTNQYQYSRMNILSKLE